MAHKKIHRNKNRVRAVLYNESQSELESPKKCWCRKTGRSLAVSRRNKMKSNLRILWLALCTLPVYLHAGTAQDPKMYQPAVREQSARTADPIPAGTILPLSLNSTLRSDKSQNGATITATVMQDVPLDTGQILRKGTKVTGHVVEVSAPGKGLDESRISFQFDQVRLGELTVPITTTLRAVASMTAVLAATPELTSPDYADYAIQIGGDQISYGTDNPVMVGARVVGKYTSQGVLANVDGDMGTPCGGRIDSNAHPQAFWLFSVNACGSYGFGDLKILHSGSADPAGETTLSSNRKAVKLGKGSAMLLRVDGSGPEEARAHTTLSRETGQ
jgi:hypothetical protein